MQTTAAYVKSPWQFQLRTIALPDTPPAGEVLIRVDACGICGTDLTTAASGSSDWQAFGHEVTGTIIKTGHGVSHLHAGQTVVLETSSYCGHCELCRNGHVDLCNKAPNFWGRPTMGFSRHMVIPACCVVPYEGLAPDIAALCEPAGVSYDMVKTAGIRLGDRVALIGPGPIALMAIPLLLRSGAVSVTCIGRPTSKRRLEVARLLGANTVTIEDRLDDHADLKRQFNQVLVTAPVDTLPSALPLLAYGGILTYIGIGTGDPRISFDANDFHYRKLQLRASFASPAVYFPAVLDLLKHDIIPGKQFISHRFPLDQIEAAMTVARDNRASVVKVVVTL